MVLCMSASANMLPCDMLLALLLTIHGRQCIPHTRFQPPLCVIEVFLSFSLVHKVPLPLILISQESQDHVIHLNEIFLAAMSSAPSTASSPATTSHRLARPNTGEVPKHVPTSPSANPRCLFWLFAKWRAPDALCTHRCWRRH